MAKKIEAPFIRAPGNYDPVAACEECCVADFGPTMTQISQQEDADINTIVRRFGLTGQLPDNIRVPQYADFDEVFDFKSAQDAVARARSSFNAMPANIRARFDNDPQQFLEFMHDEANADEIRKLGLAKAKEASETPPARSGGPGGAPDAGVPTEKDKAPTAGPVESPKR